MNQHRDGNGPTIWIQHLLQKHDLSQKKSKRYNYQISQICEVQAQENDVKNCIVSNSWCCKICLYES